MARRTRGRRKSKRTDVSAAAAACFLPQSIVGHLILGTSLLFASHLPLHRPELHFLQAIPLFGKHAVLRFMLRQIQSLLVTLTLDRNEDAPFFLYPSFNKRKRPIFFSRLATRASCAFLSPVSTSNATCVVRVSSTACTMRSCYNFDVASRLSRSSYFCYNRFCSEMNLSTVRRPSTTSWPRATAASRARSASMSIRRRFSRSRGPLLSRRA